MEEALKADGTFYSGTARPKTPTDIGFAAGYPGTPHVVCASDQIRIS